MSHTVDELLLRYIRTCWILKIRLISARRQLWGDEISLIHLESASLQIRKICEGIASLCVVISDIEFEDIPDVRSDYQVGKIFNFLNKTQKLKFPNSARLNKVVDNKDQPSQWNLDEKSADGSEVKRIKGLHDRLGMIMHEKSSYAEWPSQSEAYAALVSDFKNLRAEHQWLWNRFWHHSTRIKGKLFFVNFGAMTNSTQPSIVKMGGLIDGDLDIQFDPNYLADFTNEVDWTEFTDAMDGAIPPL